MSADSDMSDSETPSASETLEKNQVIAARVYGAQKKSIHDVSLLAMSNPATLKEPVLLFTLPTRGNSEFLGEEYRSCAEEDRHGQDDFLGKYTLGRRQISIAYLADPAFPALKMIANFKIGNFLRSKKGERGIFLRLSSVFADKHLTEEEETTNRRMELLVRRLAANDVILTRQYQQKEHFQLDTSDTTDLTPASLGVDVGIKRDVLTLLESVGYLEKVPTSNKQPVYALITDDTFQYGQHSPSVKSSGAPAKSRDTTKHYLLQTPLCCMQTLSERCFGCLYLFYDVCKKRKPYLESLINDRCRNYRDDNDPRIHKMRNKPKWACHNCQVSGKKKNICR